MNFFLYLKNYLKERLKLEEFSPSILSIILSPTYIVRRALYKNVARCAPRFKGNILDFGCGSKPYERLFINAKKYIGIDIKSSGHNHKDSKVNFFYDGKSIPFADNSFDCVVCFEVFEHVFNIDDVCSEIARVLKPNGLFLATIPFAWEEHEVPYDFARYTSFGIRHILIKNNFHVIEIIKSTTSVLAIGQLFINYISQLTLPQKWYMLHIFCFLIIFPLNSLTLIANIILPKQYSLYCTNIILSKNSKPVS